MQNSRIEDSKRFYEGTSQESRIEEQDSKLLSGKDQNGGGRLLGKDETSPLIDFEGGEDLTGLFDIPVEPEKEDKADIELRIQQAKRFYYLHFDYQINLSNEAYVRFKSMPNFNIGYKYKNLVDKMEKVELLTQVVNERMRLRIACRTMYFREASLRLDDKTNIKLLSKYLGVGLKENRVLIKKDVEEFEWFIKIYRNRLNYVSELLQDKYGLTKDQIKNIRNYEDVINYC